MRVADILGTGPGTRVAGAAIGIAGLAFIGLGTAGVGTITSVVGHATTQGATDCPTDLKAAATDTDATGVPHGDACLLEAKEGLTAVQENVTNDCGSFGLTANPTTDGWVFVLPGEHAVFGDSFWAVFAVDVNGTITTVLVPGTVQSNAKFVVVSAPAGSVLLEAYATATVDGVTTTEFFTLTGTCLATSSSTSSSSSSPASSSSSSSSPASSSSSSSSPASSSASSSSPASSSAASSEASGNLGISTSSSSASGAGGVLGVTTTTPSTGADTQFGAGLALLILGGGLIVGSTRRSKRP
jgi:hypothetical protein